MLIIEDGVKYEPIRKAFANNFTRRAVTIFEPANFDEKHFFDICRECQSLEDIQLIESHEFVNRISRCYCAIFDKSLTSEEVDSLWANVRVSLIENGYELRGDHEKHLQQSRMRILQIRSCMV